MSFSLLGRGGWGSGGLGGGGGVLLLTENNGLGEDRGHGVHPLTDRLLQDKTYKDIPIIILFSAKIKKR